MIIDSHHHFWNYQPQEFSWIPDSMAVLRRDFLTTDLQKELGVAGVDGVVTVQARQSLEETRWLLDLAGKNAFMRGVVGWVPLASPSVGETLEEFSGTKLKAVRHVVQGESDPEFMLRPAFEAGIRTLRKFDLVYDILIFERQLPQAIAFVDRHPEQVFVLDHIAKPRIGENLLEPWNQQLRELARRENVYCKLSGMVTEADVANWTPGQLRPYFSTAIEAFGPKRLLFGSDWPVCLAGVSYKGWLEIVREAIAPLSDAEKNAILGDNAVRVYQLE